MPNTRKPYPPEFRDQMVALVLKRQLVRKTAGGSG